MAPSKQHRSPPFSDVIQTYFKHVVCPLYPVAEEREEVDRAIRSFIVNLQREKHSEDEIYLKLAELNPALGDPLAFYEEFVMPFDESVAQAEKAEKKAKRAAEKAAAEFENKKQCIELEREVCDQQTAASALTTAVTTPHTEGEKQIGVGCYVHVTPDLSVGECSHGGTGFVSNVDGDRADRTFTVTYDKSSAEGGKTESMIPCSRITELPTPFATSKQARDRKAPEQHGKGNCVPPPRDTTKQPAPTEIHAILALGYSSNRGRGWRAKDLGVAEEGRQKSELFKNFLRADAKELKGYLAAHPEPPNMHTERGRKGSFKKCRNNYNPTSYTYLAIAWGVGKNFPRQVLNEQPARPKPSKPTNPTQLSVIESIDAAKAKYTAKSLFIYDRVRERSSEKDMLAYDTDRQQQQYVYREEAKVEWVLLDDNQKAFWESQARSKIARQPHIRDNIIESMRANPSKSFQQISNDIDNWCSAATIFRWFDSHKKYSTYFL